MPEAVLSTTLLTLATMVDAVIQGTHDLTPEHVVELGAALDECVAIARLLEIDAAKAVMAGLSVRAKAPVLPPNVIPFPDAASRLVRTLAFLAEPSHAQD